MNEVRRLQWMWGGAAAALAAGLWLTATAWIDWRAAERAAPRREAEWHALGAIRADGQRLSAAIAAVAAAAAAAEPALPEGPSPDSTRDSEGDPVTGWVMRRRELSYGDVDLPALLRFIAAAEAPLAEGQPGWRLARLVITALPREPGRVQAVVVLETPLRDV